MLITGAEIEPLLPHAGAMLLIDGVTAWDEEHISCISDRHRDRDNPLFRNGQLAALHAIEFAAQAAAVHGGLMSGLINGGRKAPLRALAAVRRAHLAMHRLDDLAGRMTIEARVAMLDAKAAIYQARLTSDDIEIASMRLTLMTIETETVER